MSSRLVTEPAITVSGLDLDYLWSLVRGDLTAKKLAGERVPKSHVELAENLRAAVQVRVSFPCEPVSGTSANLGTGLSQALIRTRDMADQLHVTPQYARRLAASAGIEPAARNLWHQTDVTALVTDRKRAS